MSEQFWITIITAIVAPVIMMDFYTSNGGNSYPQGVYEKLKKAHK